MEMEALKRIDKIVIRLEGIRERKTEGREKETGANEKKSDMVTKQEAGQDNCREPLYETEHILNMWKPFSFHTGSDYEYFPSGPVYLLLNRFIRLIVYLLFPWIHKIVFGLKVTGRNNLRKIKGGMVTVCNHVNIIDCVMVACNMDCRSVCFPTLESNFKIPVIRHLIRWLGAVPIPKEKGNFLKMMLSIEEYVKDGGIVHFYPETVMHPYYNGIRGFRRGAFVTAYDCNVPIVPYVITYRNPGPVLKHFKKKPCLTMHILPPVYPDIRVNKRVETERLKQEVFTAMRKYFE